jgi:hypothetical protein
MSSSGLLILGKQRRKIGLPKTGSDPACRGSGTEKKRIVPSVITAEMIPIFGIVSDPTCNIEFSVIAERVAFGKAHLVTATYGHPFEVDDGTTFDAQD